MHQGMVTGSVDVGLSTAMAEIQGAAAGVPTVIVPYAFDQPFWGARVKALGLGPDPIPRRKLTADSLAHALGVVVTDPGMKQRANQLGAAIRAEDGIGNAVKIIIKHFA